MRRFLYSNIQKKYESLIHKNGKKKYFTPPRTILTGEKHFIVLIHFPMMKAYYKRFKLLNANKLQFSIKIILIYLFFLFIDFKLYNIFVLYDLLIY